MSFLESMTEVCDSHPADYHVPTQALNRAASEAKLARKTIEELPELSFTTQGRFFRLFEWLEECMDYAGESIRYEDYGAAQTDLCRSRRGIRDAITLLTSHTGIKAPRALFSGRPTRGTSPGASTRAPQRAIREQAEPKRAAQIIYLLPIQDAPCVPDPSRPRLAGL